MSTPDAQTSYVPSALAVRPIPPGPLRTLTDTFAALSQRPTLAQMSAWLQNLQVEATDLRPYISFKPSTYARHRVFRNEHIELLVLCWRTGPRTPIHDHNGSHGLVRVWAGIMSETMFARDAQRGLLYQSGREWRGGAPTCA